IVHPRATLAASARIGRGSVVLAGGVLGPEADVSDHVIILQNTSLNHNVRVGDFTTLSAGATLLGYAEIGRNAFVGAAASIAPRSASRRGERTTKRCHVCSLPSATTGSASDVPRSPSR